MNEQKTTWEILSAINVNDKTEKKNRLTYLSWIWAWGVVKGHYSDANYKVINFDAKPYLYDENLGYMVSTEVTINGETIPMHLPIMDGANRAMKNAPYDYVTKQRTKSVGAATMMDINKAIMRCLAKNLAVFGLGHYIYAGEDLPTEEATTPEKPKPECPQEEIDSKLDQVKADIRAGKYTSKNVIDKLQTQYILAPHQVKQIKEVAA